mgnify:CR=1 FL=1
MPTLEELIGVDHLLDITISGHGDAKVAFLEQNISLLEVLTTLGFNGYHIQLITHGDGWQEKLNWVRDNYQNVLQPMGFNGYHVSQIVIGADWEEKLDWVRDNYQNVLQPMGFEPTHAAKILRSKGCEDKIDWLKKNYENSTYTQAEVARIMPSKDWLQRMNYSLTTNK